MCIRDRPYLVCLCSASPSILNDPERESFLRRMQDLLVSKLAEIKQVYVVSPNDVDTLYPVSDYFDAVRNKLGHVSYTPVFFTALGTIIARKIHAIQSRPYKLSLIHISEPTRLLSISYAVFCLKKKKQ